MAAPQKRNDFAFIVNRHPFPNPRLVHTSRVSVEDMEGKSGSFQAKCHSCASIDGFHPETNASH
jgi:hypothetical protein